MVKILELLRMKHKAYSVILLPFLFFIYVYGNPDYSLEEARKVLRLIEKVQKEQLKPNVRKLRKVVVTESELNSYIAFRIETEKEEVMKELHLKLFKDNSIEGKIFVDLRGQKLTKFLRPEMNLYFRGRIEVKDSRVRLAIEDLFLEDQPVQPMVLDLIILIASRIDKTEASSINDWYDLPYGIKDVKTDRGEAAFYY